MAPGEACGEWMGWSLGGRGVGGTMQKRRQPGEVGPGLTQRSKYVFVLSIIPFCLQLEDVEWEDWE